MPHAITPPATPTDWFASLPESFVKPDFKVVKNSQRLPISNKLLLSGSAIPPISPEPSTQDSLNTARISAESQLRDWKQPAGKFPDDPRYREFCGRMEKVVEALRGPTKLNLPPPGFEPRDQEYLPLSMRKPLHSSLLSRLTTGDISFNNVDWSMGIGYRHHCQVEQAYKKWVKEGIDYRQFEQAYRKWVKERSEAQTPREQDLDENDLKDLGLETEEVQSQVDSDGYYHS